MGFCSRAYNTGTGYLLIVTPLRPRLPCGLGIAPFRSLILLSLHLAAAGLGAAERLRLDEAARVFYQFFDSRIKILRRERLGQKFRYPDIPCFFDPDLVTVSRHHD